MKDRVLEIRKSKGMSQTSLADASGIDECVLSKIEHNKSTPFLRNALRISAALDVPVNDIFILDEKGK